MLLNKFKDRLIFELTSHLGIKPQSLSRLNEQES